MPFKPNDLNLKSIFFFFPKSYLNSLQVSGVVEDRLPLLLLLGLLVALVVDPGADVAEVRALVTTHLRVTGIPPLTTVYVQDQKASQLYRKRNAV